MDRTSAARHRLNATAWSRAAGNAGSPWGARRVFSSASSATCHYVKQTQAANDFADPVCYRRNHMVVRVCICISEPMMRTGLRAALADEPDIYVVGECSTAREMIYKAREIKPNVTVIDSEICDMDVAEAIRELRQDSAGGSTRKSTVHNILETPAYRRVEPLPPSVIMIIPGASRVLKGVLAGASGILTRSSELASYIDAIKTVSCGHAFLSPGVADYLMNWLRSQQADMYAEIDLDALTEREREVLALVAKGMSNAEIASELYIVESTVKYHVSRLLRKLGLRDRVQAAIFGHSVGLY
jgi:DNA-binding NarL/FixJ family response regulator